MAKRKKQGFKPLKLIPFKKKKLKLSRTKFSTDEDIMYDILKRKKQQEMKREKIRKLLKS